MATDIRHVKKYAEKLNEKIQLDTQIKAVSAELEKLSDGVLKYFQHQGIDRVSVEGRTLYLRREVFAGKGVEATTDEICEQLRTMGLEAYTGKKVSYPGVSAYIREQEDAGFALKDIEQQFDGKIRIAEVFKIGSTSR